MVSINSLIFKNYIGEKDIILDEKKGENGEVKLEVIKNLKNSRVLVKILIHFSGDDKEVSIKSNDYIYIGNRNKSNEIQVVMDKLNKDDSIFSFYIRDEYINCNCKLFFGDDFVSESMDSVIDELLGLLDDNYSKFMEVLYCKC